jgi:hypothetical protein
MPILLTPEMQEQIGFVRVSKTARYFKGKKVVYLGEVIYPNGRHAISVLVKTGGLQDKSGGFPAELDPSEVDFSILRRERWVSDLREVAK